MSEKWMTDDQRLAADLLTAQVSDFVAVALDQEPPSRYLVEGRVEGVIADCVATGFAEGKRRHDQRQDEQREIARVTRRFDEDVEALDDEDADGDAWSLVDVHHAAGDVWERILSDHDGSEEYCAPRPEADLALCVKHLAAHVQRLENRLMEKDDE